MWIIKAEKEGEDRDERQPVADLDTPHVGELPQFYTQPATPQASIHHQQTDQSEHTSEQTYQSEQASELADQSASQNIGQDTRPDIPQVDIVGQDTSSQSKIEPAKQDNLNIEPQAPRPAIDEVMNESETMQHIESIAPDNERAGNYEKYSESSQVPPAQEVTESSADEHSSHHESYSAEFEEGIKIAKSRVVKSDSKVKDEL